MNYTPKLPNYLGTYIDLLHTSPLGLSLRTVCYYSAYVVHAKGLSSDAEKKEFSKSVQKWIEGHVAKHKFLRGGVVVIDAIPKSASGKILRRELKDRAKQEVASEEATSTKAKL